ncbi:hypothetical protein XENTR_v10005220 [Xenopus tropicalis]|uniref:DnaJ heat shock protein family (Hsp40) member C30 n=1 Tax=Xenopus tropicalis TaxID=8364 RepID=A0A803JWW9_XENTR|nr:dnaJ homolog subfamily C member 30, mitochondrial [Xenopus tropicalis]KAE8622388.1 hypothetical protein XENTR_v10005220 [Xenopus tropicalis]|eukprot:XP_002933669.1 PREDICTED: dnaJ homolog subfamily C member 30 [Xenopus tropicalis]
MAEVSRRLLGICGRQHLPEASFGRCSGASAFCLSPLVSYSTSSNANDLKFKVVPCSDGPTIFPCSRHREWRILAADQFRGRCLFAWGPVERPVGTVVCPRFITYGTSSRASYRNNGSRHNGNNNHSQNGSLLYKSRTAYYDILGVTGNATQTQIKTAYYKQSFRYHPDRNAGSDEATSRFGEISEAYSVLGSVSLRKKYDRGILSWEDVRNAGKPSGKASSPSRKATSPQRERSSSASSNSPSKPMFNFDEFYQAHYGEQLQREQFWRQRRDLIQKLKNQPSRRWPFHKLSEISAILLLLSAVVLMASLK